MELRRCVLVPAVSLIAVLIAGCAGLPGSAPDYRAIVAEADFLRNPADPREERVFALKIPVDNFVLKFVKP